MKGTCPPSADSGQVPKAKEDKLTKGSPRGRTSLTKGVYPERNEGGQAHKGSPQNRKAEIKRGLTGLPSFHELVQNEVKEGKLTKVLPEPRIRLKKGTMTRSPFLIWLPGQDSNLQPSG